MTYLQVFAWLVDFGATEINVRFSASGSAYFEAEYCERIGISNVIRVRVSDHAHPGTYNGICLFRGDKLPEPEPLPSRRR